MNRYPNCMGQPPAEDGIHADVLAHDYHSWPLVSSSLLKAAAGGLPAAHHYLHDTEPKGWSTWFGTYMHARLLEPELVASQGETKGLSPKAQGKTFAAAAKEHGPVPIAEGWKAMGDALEQSIERNGLAADLLAQGESEVTITWQEITDTLTETRCKARLDKWCRDECRIVDVKTADDVSEHAFERTAMSFGYHIQAAHYITSVADDCGKWPEFWFVVLQNKPPFDVAVYRALHGTFIAPGMQVRSELLSAVVNADATGVWHTPQTEPKDLSLPKWGMARFMDGEVA